MLSHQHREIIWKKKTVGSAKETKAAQGHVTGWSASNRALQFPELQACDVSEQPPPYVFKTELVVPMMHSDTSDIIINPLKPSGCYM
jgi:hypothetical protein